MPHDYGQFQVEDKLDTGKLASLTNLATLQRQEEMEVERIKARLDAAQTRLNHLSQRQIPELMDEIGMAEFTTREGFKVKIKKSLRTSVPKERREAAMNWLDEHGHSAMIKRMIMVAFNKSEEEAAKILEKKLREKFPMVKQERNVHPSTLKAWVKQMLEAGESLPMDLFGVFEQRQSVIEVPKKK